MSKPVAPCKGCINRSVTCHSTCETYLTYAKNAKEYSAGIYAAKTEHYAYDNWHRQAYEKRNRGRKTG